MKTIHTLSSLLEQADLEGAKIELTGTAVTMTKADKVRIKWPYLYKWPAKNPLLGDITQFVNALNAESGKGGKSILSQIKQTDANHFVGIATDAASTQNNRLLRKDLGQLNGFVYLFYPDTINQELVPAAKKLEQVAGRFTFVVDAEWKKYLVTTDPAKPTDASLPKPAAPIGTNTFIEEDGANREWYSTKVFAPFISPVLAKLNKKSPVTITQSGAAAPIFWQFMTAVSTYSWSMDLPAEAATKAYSEDLQTNIKKLLGEAAKFDKAQFSVVSTNTLNSGLYSTMAKALTVIALNSGKVNNTSTKDSAVDYFKPLINANLMADGIAPDADGSASTATSGFDGTSVNNEMDLAKIISGGLIGYNTSAADVDTLAKVKAKWDSFVPATYVKLFSEIVAKLPFKQGTPSVITLSEFKDVQFFAIGVNGTYGPKTVAGFKSAFEKSSLK